ncbi:hypothetical protein CAPTEDRAFT_206722 [Capitella teleta]|uniref:Uncharacterized protein n=1 Tax=Capitella teleta TaxID=283909 RepID=R7TVS2_CAPTE|nr:hypothetical protein CAPTEDRAFT_206722 [Capitella teleta]|eukprot:ELT97687.1 hypothetical protein CAPTEDRAFT_206722 [Capitella teleta]
MSIAERTKSKASQYRQLKESEGGRQFLQENLVKQTAIREPRVPGQETQLRQLTEIIDAHPTDEPSTKQQKAEEVRHRALEREGTGQFLSRISICPPIKKSSRYSQEGAQQHFGHGLPDLLAFITFYIQHSDPESVYATIPTNNREITEAKGAEQQTEATHSQERTAESKLRQE